MSFFRNFPIVNYKFGNEISTTLFQNLTSYIDLIDQVTDDAAFYETYTIIDGERPDSVSYKLYNSVNYYWTFALLNEKIRTQGWPLTTQQIYSLSKEYYPNLTLTTSRSLHGEFYAGDIVATQPFTNPTFKAKILEKNLDLGQIVVKPILEVRTITITDAGSGYTTAPTVTVTGGSGTGATLQAFLTGDSVSSISILTGGEDYLTTPTVTISSPNISNGVRATATVSVSTNNISGNTNLYSQKNIPDTRLWQSDLVYAKLMSTSTVQYNSVHHYENANGDWMDLDVNLSGGGVQNSSFATAGLTPITYLDRLVSQNDELAQIKIFKPRVASQIDIEFQKLLRTK